MIIFSGGTGTPKLIRGLLECIPENQMSVVVNTAEDVYVSGCLVSPDIDTVLYLFSGLLDCEKWWGIADDTFRTSQILQDLGFSELLPLGDTDRAICIARTQLMTSGKSLTEATRILAQKMSISASVFPMTDVPVQTFVTTDAGEKMHYQKYWVGLKGTPGVRSVDIEFPENVSISQSLLSEFKKHDSVLIGPSNPVTSIGPILSVPEIREILKDKYVVAVSPFIGNTPVSGPAGKFMHACGIAPGSYSVFEMYKDFSDVFVCDIRDTTWTCRNLQTA